MTLADYKKESCHDTLDLSMCSIQQIGGIHVMFHPSLNHSEKCSFKHECFEEITKNKCLNSLTKIPNGVQL